MVFETLGVAWGYIFVLVIAGCSLIIGYYRGKGLIKLPLGKTKSLDETEEEGKTATETEFAVPPKDKDNEGDKSEET